LPNQSQNQEEYKINWCHKPLSIIKFCGGFVLNRSYQIQRGVASTEPEGPYFRGEFLGPGVTHMFLRTGAALSGN
jgi:hypothetical protein